MDEPAPGPSKPEAELLLHMEFLLQHVGLHENQIKCHVASEDVSMDESDAAPGHSKPKAELLLHMEFVLACWGCCIAACGI